MGTYTLEASQGGCLEVGSEDVEVTEDVEVDFALGRKLDHFGHGCKPIPFNWANAADQTALFGDDVYGRLLLPEAVSFYGVEYEALFIGSNGHVGYVDPCFSSPLPTAIPDPETPNAAVYGLWQDLVLDGPATVNYGFKRSGGVWSATIEYRDVYPFEGSGAADFQVKVFDNDATEIHWGDVEDLGGGARATIGIENAEGDDALQYGFREPVASSGTAIRFEVMADATITGVVTNANDGLPVEGATWWRRREARTTSRTPRDGSP